MKAIALLFLLLTACHSATAANQPPPKKQAPEPKEKSEPQSQPKVSATTMLIIAKQQELLHKSLSGSATIAQVDDACFLLASVWQYANEAGRKRILAILENQVVHDKALRPKNAIYALQLLEDKLADAVIGLVLTGKQKNNDPTVRAAAVKALSERARKLRANGHHFKMSGDVQQIAELLASAGASDPEPSVSGSASAALAEILAPMSAVATKPKQDAKPEPKKKDDNKVTHVRIVWGTIPSLFPTVANPSTASSFSGIDRSLKRDYNSLIPQRLDVVEPSTETEGGAAGGQGAQGAGGPKSGAAGGAGAAGAGGAKTRPPATAFVPGKPAEAATAVNPAKKATPIPPPKSKSPPLMP